MTDRTYENTSFKKPTSNRSGLGNAASNAMDSVVEAGETIVTQVGNAASEVGKQVGSAANSAIEAGTDAASYAVDQAKSFTSEIEGFARRNPLGALGGALAIGVLIGMLGRGRN